MAATSSRNMLQPSLTSAVTPEMQTAFDTERQHGNSAYRRGDYPKALEHYTQAELLNPLSPLPPANRAMVHLKLQDWQKAREDAAVALELIDAAKELDVAGGGREGGGEELTGAMLTLKVKILQRRAAACAGLSLYALAAQDYSSILRIDASHAEAKQALEALKREHNVNVRAASASIAASAPASGSDSVLRPSSGLSSTVSGRMQMPQPLPRRTSGQAGPTGSGGGGGGGGGGGIRVLADLPAKTQEKTMSSLSANGHHETQTNTTKTRSTTTSQPASNRRQTAGPGNTTTRTTSTSTPLLQLPVDAMAPLLATVCATPPRDSSQFEHGWRTLRDDPHRQAIFLVRTTGATRIRRGVLGDGVTAQMLVRFAHVMWVGLEEREGEGGGEGGGIGAMEVVEVLRAVGAIRRFGMLVMFLGEEDKRVIDRLFQRLRRLGIEEDVLRELEAMYLA